CACSRCLRASSRDSFFFYTPPSTPQISTLSLHDALPISHSAATIDNLSRSCAQRAIAWMHYAAAIGQHKRLIKRYCHTVHFGMADRKSTRLNSSHVSISYAVFCLKKKKKEKTTEHITATT